MDVVGVRNNMSIKDNQRLLYLQVIDRLKDDIEKGIYQEGDQLPSEFVLARQLGVSRATLREAFRVLEDENIVIRRHGVGTFVRSRPLLSAGIEQLFSITDMIRRAGQEPGTNFLSSSLVPPSEEEKKRFQLDQDNMLEIERVRTADGAPVVYCLDHIPSNILQTPYASDKQSVFHVLESESGRHIAYAVTQIEPVGFHEKISPILECPQEATLLLLKQMHYDANDEPMLYSMNYFRADKFQFHVLRNRL